MIKQLTEIRHEIVQGCDARDWLYIKMQVNKIDTLIYNDMQSKLASKKEEGNNEAILKNELEFVQTVDELTVQVTKAIETINALREKTKKQQEVLRKWQELGTESDMRPEDECMELLHLTNEVLNEESSTQKS